MEARPDGSVLTITDLHGRLLNGDKIFIVDVRTREEFERFQLEGRSQVPTINIPYFEMLELGGKEDMLESVVAFSERELAKQLPRDMPILAVCAKGNTSEYVAQGLRQLGFDCASLQGGIKAWGEHYATHTIIESPDLCIYQISRTARGCLSYVVTGAGKAIVIDPLRHLHPYLDLAKEKGLTIETVIDTHGHADHISGGVALAAKTGATYYLHPYDAIHPIDIVPATIAYKYIREGQAFRVGQHELRSLHIPGHTLGLVALQLGNEYLFTGDSIFIRSIARPDLGGKSEAWAPLHAASLRRLLMLPGEVRLLPGHFSTLAEADQSGRFAATLDELKSRNDGLLTLQRESEAGFVRYLLESLPPSVPEYFDIKRVNAGLLAVDEEQAATLELGKNVCALSQAHAARDGAPS